MLTLRKATSEDVPLLLLFIKELADYEREPNAVHCTIKDLDRDGFGEKRIFSAIIADWNGQPAGMALYYYYYSTWAGGRGIFLEDLFIRPKFRNLSVGRALMVQLARTAVEEECYGLRWEVLEWNAPAIGFYDHLGSEFRKDVRVMQLTGEKLKRLAEERAKP